ncbi:MAG: 50S ribosomal protein L24 [Chloroflexota bacterium]|nr:50S ribosomal protein L24 [Chloroflexota bacterium]
MARQYQTERATKVPEIRKGDTVVVLAGKDAGKRGVVERVIQATAHAGGARSVYRRGSSAGGVAVVVDGLNISKRHTKPRQTSSQTDRMPKVQQGGILDLAQPLPIGKVMVVCSKCERPTRIAHTTLDNGKRIRVCHHCGEPLEGKST